MQTTHLIIIARHASGFEVHIPVCSMEEIDATTLDLEKRGYRPTSGSADGYMHTPSGEPICSKHQVPMRLREKQGDSWWNHQVVDPRTGEELWCRGYAGANSPGWAVVPT